MLSHAASTTRQVTPASDQRCRCAPAHRHASVVLSHGAIISQITTSIPVTEIQRCARNGFLLLLLVVAQRSELGEHPIGILRRQSAAVQSRETLFFGSWTLLGQLTEKLPRVAFSNAVLDDAEVLHCSVITDGSDLQNNFLPK